MITRRRSRWPKVRVKRTIVDWLTTLIDQGHPAEAVWDAFHALQDYVQWWQRIHDYPWHPYATSWWDRWVYRWALRDLHGGVRHQRLAWIAHFHRWIRQR